jgi:hypothetical protein
VRRSRSLTSFLFYVLVIGSAVVSGFYAPQGDRSGRHLRLAAPRIAEVGVRSSRIRLVLVEDACHLKAGITPAEMARRLAKCYDRLAKTKKRP